MVTGIYVVLAALVFAAMWHGARPVSRQLDCRRNLGAIGIAIHRYAADHDDHFPLKDNWCDAILTDYLKNAECLRCPALPGERAGYAYNAHLSGADAGTRPLRDDTVLVFDGKGGWNSSGGAELVDARHRGSWGLCPVGMQRRWQRPEDVDSVRWDPYDGSDGGGTR